MNITIDNPKTRAGVICPLCMGSKLIGHVVCWPCYHKHDMRRGNTTAERAIDQFERAQA